MPTIDQLYNALDQADKNNDQEAVQEFTQQIRELKAKQLYDPATGEGSRSVLGGLWEGAQNLPMNLIKHGLKAGDIAYDTIQHPIEADKATREWFKNAATTGAQTVAGGLLNIPTSGPFGVSLPGSPTVGEGISQKLSDLGKYMEDPNSKRTIGPNLRPILEPLVKQGPGAIADVQQTAADVGHNLRQEYWGKSGQGLLNKWVTDPGGLLFDVGTTLAVGPESKLARLARAPAKLALSPARGLYDAISNTRIASIAKDKAFNTAQKIAQHARDARIPGMAAYNFAPDLAARVRGMSPGGAASIDQAISSQMDPVAVAARKEQAKRNAFGPRGLRDARQQAVNQAQAGIDTANEAHRIASLPPADAAAQATAVGQRNLATRARNTAQRNLNEFDFGRQDVWNPETEISQVARTRNQAADVTHLEEGVSRGARAPGAEAALRDPASGAQVQRNIDTALNDRGMASNILLDRLRTEDRLARDQSRIQAPRPLGQDIVERFARRYGPWTPSAASTIVSAVMGDPTYLLAGAAGSIGAKGLEKSWDFLKARKGSAMARELTRAPGDLLQRVINNKALRKAQEQALTVAADIARKKREGDETRR